MKQLELGTRGDSNKLTIPECYPRVPGESDGATLRRYLLDYPHKAKGQTILDLHPTQGDEEGAEWWDD